MVFTAFILLFLLIVELFAILFKITGMDHRKARFQVISLLTSTGFSTKESEQIMNHTTRRKIASIIMIFGYASTVTLVSFVIKILERDIKSVYNLIIIFVIVCTGIYILNKTMLIDKCEEFIENHIRRNSLWIKFNIKEQEIISRNKGYGIVEVPLKSNNYIIGKSILESNLKSYEVQVLSIDKGDSLIKFPKKDYIFEEGDVLAVYGNLKNINSLFKKTK